MLGFGWDCPTGRCRKGTIDDLGRLASGVAGSDKSAVIRLDGQHSAKTGCREHPHHPRGNAGQHQSPSASLCLAVDSDEQTETHRVKGTHPVQVDDQIVGATSGKQPGQLPSQGGRSRDVERPTHRESRQFDLLVCSRCRSVSAA